MLFTVSQISPSVELVFANSDKFINVYPEYHQVGGLNYRNVDVAAWSLVGTQYRWSASLPIINADTVPVIQLIYSYNATSAQRQQQYNAFKSITSVETAEGVLYLYTPIQPTVGFRIRFRTLNKVDLAINLNQLYARGLAYQGNPTGLTSILTAFNPVANLTQNLAANVPLGTSNAAGAMPAGFTSRLAKLEKTIGDLSFQPTKNAKITGYSDAGQTTLITQYYTDVVDIQGGSPWYGDCVFGNRPNSPTNPDCSELFKNQTATGWDVTEFYSNGVIDMSYFFADNANLTQIIGLDLLDTGSLTDISYMFSGDSLLTHLDLSAWITQNITNIEGLFKNCSGLTEIDVRNFDFTYKPDGVTALIEQADVFTGVPNDCVIWVGGEVQYNAIHAAYPNLTGITYN